MNNPFNSTNRDNLTDLVGSIPQGNTTPAPQGGNTQPQQSGPQQVVSTDGQVITLGQNQTNN